MNNTINTIFGVHLKPLLLLTLWLGALLLSIVEPVWAAASDCTQERLAVTKALSTHLPANPQLVRDALLLRREGEVLCQQGDAETGRAKLKKAVAVLNPDSNEAAADLDNKKGDSHE